MYQHASPLPAVPKRIVKHLIPRALWEYLRIKRVEFINNRFDVYRNHSYSQEGEDLILARALGRKADGFYIDVGAHHPKKYSNTYMFYRMGWSGINIDALPGSMNQFRRFRPRDINLEIAVSDKEEEKEYYIFRSPALNTFDYDIAMKRQEEGKELVDVISLRTKRLADIIQEHAAIKKTIDFLSIDVEGSDLKVLKSNDWIIFRPRYVCAEVEGSTLETGLDSDIARYLGNHGYGLLAKTFQTLIFKDGL
jgi:FkbM family methyltransferase